MENSFSQLYPPFSYEGGMAIDDRGKLSFVSAVPFQRVKRFYMVENFSTTTVRAFHGHKKEWKYIFVASGSAIVVASHLPEWKPNVFERFVLSAAQPRVVEIPPGWMQGFRTLEQHTRIMFFSTATLEESQEDDIRAPYDYLGSEIWEVKGR